MTKKALLIGINYKDTPSQLMGCINDVDNVENILTGVFKYDKIKKITDDTIDKPRKNSILRNIDWLIENNKPGDELFFHYSGHGSWVYDCSNDEHDGKDECLVPLDYSLHGLILDDVLQEKIVKKLGKDIKMTIIMDCCHSATALDLKYECQLDSKNEFIKKDNPNYPNVSNIMMISGCRDDQTSADAYISSTFQGALTHTLLNVLKNNNYKVTNELLLKQLHNELKNGKYTQRPVLTSGTEINLNEHFSLCLD